MEEFLDFLQWPAMAVSLYAAFLVGSKKSGKRILGFNYDTGERYLSVPDFLPEQA